MAYGLRTIQNKGYVPYGSGRDAFFILDPSYRNGRRTPLPEDGDRTPAPTGRLLQPKRPPVEIARSKAAAGSRGGRSGVNPQAVEKWRLSDSERPLACTGEFERWSQSRVPPRAAGGGSGALPRSASAPQYATTSSDVGRELKHDGLKLGDKYQAFSMPIMDSARYDHLDSPKVVAESRSVRAETVSGARPFDESPGGLGDKYKFLSTPVGDSARWDYLDRHRLRFPAPELKGRKYAKVPRGDKYPYFSTPISDIARFGYVDAWRTPK